VTYNWNWAILVTEPYVGWILSGLMMTLAIACAASVIAFVLGSIVGIFSTVPSRACRAVAIVYVELFRNIPLLVQMFLWYFVLPELLPAPWGHYLKRDLPIPEVQTAILCLGFYEASRIGETVRAGIQSVREGKSQAGLAIGLTTFQLYRYVLLPMSYRVIIPPLTNIFLGTVKDSSLALTIGVFELTAASRQIEVYTFQGFEAFSAATALYQIITLCVMFATRQIERKTHIPGMASLSDK
jgi:glutamate/aspartate transport system permease protein